MHILVRFARLPFIYYNIDRLGKGYGNSPSSLLRKLKVPVFTQVTRAHITAKDLPCIIAYKANLKPDAHRLCIWYVPYITSPLLRSYSASMAQEQL